VFALLASHYILEVTKSKDLSVDYVRTKLVHSRSGMPLLKSVPSWERILSYRSKKRRRRWLFRLEDKYDFSAESPPR
jgi:hypothetical protein